jgi:hypothetical protein
MGAVKDSLRVKKAGPRLASRQRYAQHCFSFSAFFYSACCSSWVTCSVASQLFIISSLKRKSKT